MADVEIRNVKKVFKREATEVVALNNTNLSLESGGFLCLMGPSGSGKSTLLNLIAGIDRPTSGEVLVDGKNLSTMSESQLATWRNQTIGFIFQSFNLIPVLTAFENVELPLLLTKLSKFQRRAHVETALSLVGLTEWARVRDALSLWHLLPNLDSQSRGRVYDRLAQLLPPPAEVT